MFTKKEINEYMEIAKQTALNGMNNNIGGPFGAIIVRNSDKKMIGMGCNSVTSINDPTAHAEVMAIRDACKNIKNFILNDTTLFTTCFPCPMCMSAIYWARIPYIIYSGTSEQAAQINFDDSKIYKFIAEINSNNYDNNIIIKSIDSSYCEDIFNKWKNKQDRIQY